MRGSGKPTRWVGTPATVTTPFDQHPRVAGPVGVRWSPISRSVPEGAQLSGVVQLVAHADSRHVAGAVADIQPPAGRAGARPPGGHPHRSDDVASRAGPVVVNGTHLGHHRALSTATAGDERN